MLIKICLFIIFRSFSHSQRFKVFKILIIQIFLYFVLLAFYTNKYSNCSSGHFTVIYKIEIKAEAADKQLWCILQDFCLVGRWCSNSKLSVEQNLIFIAQLWQQTGLSLPTLIRAGTFVEEQRRNLARCCHA